MATYTIPRNTPLTINVNEAINNNSSGYWKIVGNTLVHDNSIVSYIDKYYDFLVEGNSYQIIYTANRQSCNHRVYLGDTAGTLRSNSGTFTQVLTFTGTDKRLRFWANGNVTVTSITIRELQLVTEDQPLDLSDINLVENRSFTLSYSPIAKQWLSFHSYLPNNYITHPNSLLTKRNDSQIMQVNKGEYGNYFDDDIKPFIIESIFNEGAITTKVFDNITVNLKSEFNKIPTNKFFDSIVLSTEYQCSGEIVLDTTNLTKKERNWCINKFNDIVNNTNNTLFSSNWEDIKEEYPIDKVVNPNKIDNNKPWYQRGRFRDKFLKVRFIENNLENNLIICNFVSTIFRPSQR